MIKFEEKLVDISNLYIKFWRELQEDNPESAKLITMGYKISELQFAIQEIYQQLEKMNFNNLKIHQIYGNYASFVLHDNQEGVNTGSKLHKIHENLNQQPSTNEKLKYGENANTLIVTISGNIN